jgi:hypothetical protein
LQLLQQAREARREDRPDDALRFSRDAVETCRAIDEAALLVTALKANVTDGVAEYDARFASPPS